MRTQIKTWWTDFMSQFKKKDRSEIVQDIISNTVNSLMENGNQLSASEIAFIVLGTQQRVKQLLSERAEMLRNELTETVESVNTL